MCENTEPKDNTQTQRYSSSPPGTCMSPNHRNLQYLGYRKPIPNAHTTEKNKKMQANNPQEPANHIRSNFTTGMAMKKSGWADEGSLLQERAHNTVP